MGRQRIFPPSSASRSCGGPQWGAVLRMTTLLTLSLVTHTGCAPRLDFEAGPDVIEDSVDSASTDDSDAGTQSAAPHLTDDTLSNEAVLGLLPGKQYRGAGFRIVNTKPFPSTVSPEKTVVLWISEAGYDEFVKVSPDATASNVVLPVGTVIVREVLKAGVLDTITLMAKLPEGSFPLGGDWWYAAADPDGQIRLDSKTQTPLAGLLQNCGTCHLRRNSDDFLFGTPRAYLP